MPKSPKVDVGDNVPTAVDAKHKLRVEQRVTKAVTDVEQLSALVIAAKGTLGVGCAVLDIRPSSAGVGIAQQRGLSLCSDRLLAALGVRLSSRTVFTQSGIGADRLQLRLRFCFRRRLLASIRRRKSCISWQNALL
jgi:hypothetical protein